VKEPRLVEHRFGSSQPLLWPADAVEWHVVRRAAPQAGERDLDNPDPTNPADELMTVGDESDE
jgi:hypothetical protein